jgi:lysophospholipase L1-like esterase
MRIVFACWLVVTAIGCQRTMTAEKPQTAGPSFLALGDSYTIGESVDSRDRWPAQLARLLRETGTPVADPRIIARTGWTTDELSRAMDAEVPAGPYQLVTLLIGVNNQYRGRSVADFRPQFRALLQRAIGLADGHASRVIVVSIPDYGVTPYAAGSDRGKIGREIDEFNAVCQAESTALGAAFVDITPESRTAASNPSLIAPDGLHPSAKMYREWVEQILPTAQAALKAQPLTK